MIWIVFFFTPLTSLLRLAMEGPLKMCPSCS
jgi:hypothetical protein